MVKNITLSADEALIEAARARARAERTTLNEAFRLWLSEYAQVQRRLERHDAVLATLEGRFELGQPLSRDQRNAR